MNPNIVYVNRDHLAGDIYEKECRVCKKQRKFYAGTERDRQSVCGNCWVW